MEPTNTKSTSWKILFTKSAFLLVIFSFLCINPTQVYAEGESALLKLPQLSALNLDQELNVIVTTSIIADVVAQVGGDAIELTSLLTAGQDPHSYEPSAQDIASVSQADVVFVNGWNLEESLVSILEEASSAPLVAISANITPLEFEDKHEHEGETHEESEHEDEEHKDEHDEEHHDEEHSGEEEHEDEHDHNHEGADPHVWQDVNHVMQWVKNTEEVLSRLDPANASLYESNAAAYLAELEALSTYIETNLSSIPEDKRFIVSNHDAFAYFADAYDFEIVGTVIPSFSTLAEPSASDLVELVETLETYNLCTIFTETTANDQLAQTVANELDHCQNVQVLSLYTGALGEAGSAADSYIAMMQSNTDTFVQGLNY